MGCVCLSVCLFVCLSVCLSAYLSLYLSGCLAVSRSAYLLLLLLCSGCGVWVTAKCDFSCTGLSHVAPHPCPTPAFFLLKNLSGGGWNGMEWDGWMDGMGLGWDGMGVIDSVGGFSGRTPKHGGGGARE